MKTDNDRDTFLWVWNLWCNCSLKKNYIKEIYYFVKLEEEEEEENASVSLIETDNHYSINSVIYLATMKLWYFLRNVSYHENADSILQQVLVCFSP